MLSQAWKVLVEVAGVALSARYLSIWIEMAHTPRWLHREQRHLEGKLAHLDAGCPLPLVVFVVPAYEEPFSIRRALRTLYASVPPTIASQVRFLVVTTEKERAHRRTLLAQLPRFCAEHRRKGARGVAELFGHCDALLRRRVESLVAIRLEARELERALRQLIESWPYTWDAAPEFEKKPNAPRWLHSSDVTGNMATQLDVALRWLNDRQSSFPSTSTYFVVYNADTVPAPDTVEKLMALLVSHREIEAAQLMCVPLLNFGDVLRKPFGTYLAGAALYQSRWTLGYEFSMLRRMGEGPLPRFQRMYHYCRGHGMTFRVDLLLRLGGFETSTALEDVFMGYALSCLGKGCYAIPVLEWTESPDCLRSLVRQKAWWFSGMMDLFRYPRLLREHGLESPPRWRHALILFIGCYREIFTWLLGPTLTFLFMCAAVIAGGTSAWWALLPVMNAAITVEFVLREAHKYPSCTKIDTLHRIAITAGVLAYSLTRNLGPLICLARRMGSRGMRLR